ncbi:AfsR/SARP family transcriptional regulator [Amycolatopsis panacis]|uniref:SARP family transcriptional regulator n=1 Tax=Amycolatopsis panacis TaxID=2340917 RepID=A0A419HPY3_9PSEU|nr:tetratricopeptide repeat protein [Amycolatopsis panacis]RJQ78407.1 SARP family transcriptional regulator [Amycolatopsis panacis]
MLGPLEAWHEGAPVDLGKQQQRFVLTVLLLHANKPLSADRLTEIIWGANPERRTLIRGYINKLRKAFDPAEDVAIETTVTGYLLRVSPEQLDLHRFDQWRAQARQEQEPRRQIELLRSALDLWRGRFLEDIDIDRVGGTDVISPAEGYFDTVGDLAELELANGDHRSARDRLRRIVGKEPDRQRHAGLLMRALLANGDRVEAIRMFHRTCAALAELDLEPGPRLRTIAARAERDEPASSLPSRPGGFIGRENELDLIATAAGTGEKAVWVSGAPGVGKTGLALEAAHRLRKRFPDRQVLLRLNGFTPNVGAMTTGDALTQLLLELGVPAEQLPASPGRRIAMYQNELSGTRTLILLDNAKSAGQVRALLPDDPGCLAIVTSRRVGEPDTGQQVRLAPLPPDDAAALFCTLAVPQRVAGRAPEVAEVVKRCGHLPMPIRVCAALFRRHDRWPLEHLLRLLADSGPWQAGAGNDAGAAAVRVSYQQLSEHQQEMFRLLGHAPGPHVSVAGAAALVDSTLTHARLVLDGLHEVCLIEELTPERYQMLDPLKEFAAAEPGEHTDAVLRLLDFFLVTLADAAGAAYPFERARLPAVTRTSPVARTFDTPDAATAWITAERDNLVAAIRYAATHDLPGHAWRLAVLIWRYFHTTSQFDDWAETMELARRLVTADEDNTVGQAHVLLRLAAVYNRRGELAAALQLARRALACWVRLGDARGEATTLCAIAIPTMELGRHAEAITHLETALEKYEEAGDLRGQAHALSNLGYLNELHGNLDVALRQHRAAMPILRETQHTHGLAHALNNLGSVRQRLGFPSEALADHQEAHHLASELDDVCVMAYALSNIGNVHRSAGRIPEAERYQEKAARIAAGVLDADLRTRLFRDRAATAQAKGDNVEALRLYEAALELAATSGNRGHRAHADRGVAQTLHRLGRHGDAVANWEAAEKEFAELELPEAGQVRTERAELTCACRDGVR